MRLAVDELLGEDGLSYDREGRDILAALADEPDLWDVNLADWSNDSQTSRFSEEGFQEPYISFVKSMTSKPVVGVGRYTSPDTMARVIGKGVLDFIGAARPSISDPFLPNKIRDGRIDDIRECIGCNICVAGDRTRVPIRCTQNPTMGEEWRRGWHPETIPPLEDKGPYLVVGGGPAGLEAALALARRGAEVVLAEAGSPNGEDGFRGRAGFPASRPGPGCATGGSVSFDNCPTSGCISKAGSRPSTFSNTAFPMSFWRRARPGARTGSAGSTGRHCPSSPASRS